VRAFLEALRDGFLFGTKVAGIVAVFVGLVIIGDVVNFWWFYSRGRDSLILYGAIQEDAARIMATLFAILMMLLFHRIFVQLLLRKKKIVAMKVVAAVVLWSLPMYVVKTPYMAGALFNGQGGALYKFAKMPNGEILKYPRGLKYDPKTNRPLSDFDTATADEYLAQEAKKKAEAEKAVAKPQAQNTESGFFDWLFGKEPAKPTPPEWVLSMEVEQIEVLPDKTAIHFAVKRTDKDRAGFFYEPSGNYLTDEKGQTYDLARSGAAYQSAVDAETHTVPFTSGKRAFVQDVRRDETYRFIDEYPPLAEGIHHLRLHDSRFAEVDLDYRLWQGQFAAEAKKREEAERFRVAKAEADKQAALAQEAQKRLEEKNQTAPVKPVPEEAPPAPKIEEEPIVAKIPIEMNPVSSLLGSSVRRGGLGGMLASKLKPGMPVIPIQLKVQTVQITMKRIRVFCTVSAVDHWQIGYLVAPNPESDSREGEWSPYLVDENGRTFNFVGDTGNYPDRSAGSPLLLHTLKPFETYDIVIDFATGLSTDVKELKMYHRQFGIFSIPLPQAQHD
jgi:hypothetical protein